MSAIHIALLGYGTVGKGVYQTVKSHQKKLQALFGKEVKIVGILVKNINKHTNPDEDVLLTDDFEKIITLEQLDVVIDAIVGKEPCFSYLQQAIKRGCHVITANKEMFAHHGGQLKHLASEYGVSLGFEATVAGGIPVIQTLKQLLNVNNIEKVQGILNGTSNFILTKMREENLPFASALKLAQEKGYAEADPTNDVDGYDAFYKAVILSELAFGEAPNWDESIREGIRGITPEQIEVFSSLGFRFKHVASIERTASGILCTVKPVLVNEQHPFYHVEGVQNAVSINGDIVGNISLQGPGAGMLPTASAMIEDLAHIHTKSVTRPYTEQNLEGNEASTLSFWAIGGDVNATTLPTPIQVIERIHPNVLIVRAPEETMYAIHLPNVHVYQILGEVAFREVVLS
ncbi:homoserine dehydrogenase [Bacillus sp. DTU_2020_1000418_1_SI_GHA_SEK_038]|uniref:homoserine dehydrogenase n=1 Tax=Bacillus sp. DTU_2020_1000418_1_SI_GHA_SEK_038 TaxID=3077585 RepID=UPI0028E4308B|nr:homoserine dehydrogenase [Bacillus sp. DTU_2020_1000418_1_SI_GHA_SEK_038]WNS75145.1 homoserine dehydrogenase [Bacillus sp. DTU_2020_1000418_1_SI_GHA_SEK_038]